MSMSSCGVASETGLQPMLPCVRRAGPKICLYDTLTMASYRLPSLGTEHSDGKRTLKLARNINASIHHVVMILYSAPGTSHHQRAVPSLWHTRRHTQHEMCTLHMRHVWGKGEPTGHSWSEPPQVRPRRMDTPLQGSTKNAVPYCW